MPHPNEADLKNPQYIDNLIKRADAVYGESDTESHQLLGEALRMLQAMKPAYLASLKLKALTVTLPRQQWLSLISAATARAKKYRRDDAAKPFTPEPGHVNLKLALAGNLESAVAAINEALLEE